ncbi:MAG: hypothetical protein HC890_12290 [Chloroflexaceae bacterium]|nr:hypothetical protein [Chloroflexaceae bacterium]
MAMTASLPAAAGQVFIQNGRGFRRGFVSPGIRIGVQSGPVFVRRRNPGIIIPPSRSFRGRCFNCHRDSRFDRRFSDYDRGFRDRRVVLPILVNPSFNDGDGVRVVDPAYRNPRFDDGVRAKRSDSDNPRFDDGVGAADPVYGNRDREGSVLVKPTITNLSPGQTSAPVFSEYGFPAGSIVEIETAP